MKKFWMLYVEGRSGPGYKHQSEASAKAEAETLGWGVSRHGGICARGRAGGAIPHNVGAGY